MLPSSGPVLNLKPSAGSAPFQTKYIFLRGGARIILGRQHTSSEATAEPATTTITRPRSASATNGLFAIGPNHDGIDVETNHAEVWLENGKVFVRDLDSQSGTFINGERIIGSLVLQDGDILAMGSVNDAKSSIIMSITLVGLAS